MPQIIDFDPQTQVLISRYLGAGLALGFGGIGASIGMGNAAGNAVQGMMRQPSDKGSLLRTMLIGQAIGGDASIFSLVIGLLILFVPVQDMAHVGGNVMAGFIGAGLSIGLGAFGSGLGCGMVAGSACSGAARNPSKNSTVTSSMIIGQAVAQSPCIFATVISLLLLFRQHPGTELMLMGCAVGAGIAIGASALGSGWGSGVTAGGSLEGIGRWPRSRGLVLRTMLISQAVCETPAIFGLLIAFVLIFASQNLELGLTGFAKALAAGISVGFGGIGPGYGSGLAGGPGCQFTAEKPGQAGLLLRTMLIGQAVAQSTAIYALIISLLILFVL